MILRHALALALLAGPAAVTAQAAPAASVQADRLATLAPFVDGLAAHAIATREVAGAVVTVVYQGKVVFTRGYGRADVDKGVPVDPERTMFHPGSVSKLFTWTALMQQVEAGRVDLDADVNTYIDFRIPPFEGKPIRVRDLLSHSPGMSDVGGFITYEPGKIVPYADWIKAHVPQRLWAPGTEIAYSNYGAALAGYIVERVSGEPFADYTERHVFRPLGMLSTSFREPLPGALGARMATGYKFDDGRLVAKGPEYLSSIMPAGSSSATAPDMARYMLAMLGQGRLGAARILSPQSVALLFRNSLANAPGLPGMAHGYLVYREAGPRLVGHAGNTVDFHSDLILSPETGFGFFVSTSGGTGSSLARTEMSRAIVGRMFPEAPMARWTGTGDPVVGGYRANRRDYAKPADAAHDVRVTSAGPHHLTLKIEGAETAWDQVGAQMYEQVTGANVGGPFDRLVFYGTAADPRMSFASQPYETYHLVKPE